MRSLDKALLGALLLVALPACGDSPPDTAAQAAAPAQATQPAPPDGTAPAGAVRAAAEPTQGTAQVSLQAEGIDITGDFPADACGGAYILGRGVVYRTHAEGWQITIATENRQAGNVALSTPDGDNQVIATVNGPGKQFVRKPSLGGTLTLSEDFRHAVADLQLAPVMERETARLQVTFDCGGA